MAWKLVATGSCLGMLTLVLAGCQNTGPKTTPFPNMTGAKPANKSTDPQLLVGGNTFQAPGVHQNATPHGLQNPSPVQTSNHSRNTQGFHPAGMTPSASVPVQTSAPHFVPANNGQHDLGQVPALPPSGPDAFLGPTPVVVPPPPGFPPPPTPALPQ
ncbi:MAG: hypothetical protein L0215_19580 [Gemmataceae bacterium]|nr:hypothetical protein [Gemmataceae bacterium]